MTTYQACNKKINAWVKYKYSEKGGCNITDVKQNEPMKKFIGVKIRGQRK